MSRMVSSFLLKHTEDNDQLYQLLDFPRVLDDSSAGAHCGGRYTLAPSAVNTQVVFGPEVTNARWVILWVTSGEVLYRINNTGSQPASLSPLPAASADALSSYQKEPQPGVIVMGRLTATAPVTTLYLSNPSPTESAVVTVHVIGEAA